MLLRSVISESLLAAGTELVVVAPNVREEYFRQEFSHPLITLADDPSHFSRFESYLINLRQYFLMNPSLGATLNHKSETFRRQSPYFYWFSRGVNSVVGRVAAFRRAYMAVERWAYPGKDYDALLKAHRPDLVVTGTPGYNRQDIHLLRAAKRAKISTATVMLSWDNLTSKGYMGAIPDHLLVWSDLMADEAVHYHGFPRARIQWTGAAQFDHNFGLKQRLDRRAWRRARGLAEDVPLIVYGTINPGIAPHEAAIVGQIVEAMRSRKFQSRPHLWVRIHPQAVKGYYRQNLEAYQALAGPDVTIEIPPVQSEKLAWDLPKSDAAHLAELLAAADVVATPSSTLVIDAVCVETPVITIAFDGPEPMPPEKQVKRFSSYTHYAKILGTGGMGTAHSCQIFIDLVDQYVRDPATHQAGREAMIRQQLNQLDGQAGKRTAEALLQLAGFTRPRE